MVVDAPTDDAMRGYHPVSENGRRREIAEDRHGGIAWMDPPNRMTAPRVGKCSRCRQTTRASFVGFEDGILAILVWDPCGDSYHFEWESSYEAYKEQMSRQVPRDG